MILQQYYLTCLSHASYLLVDERTKTAAVFDPQRDIDQYLADAERLGARIEVVFLTHFHADFVAGHLELRARTGARILLGAKADAEYQFEALHDGESVVIGDVRVQVLETPGHTPESVCYTIYDRKVSDTRPHAVITGDTLFAGDVGRPDLMASIGVSAAELAGWLYDSLHNKLLRLPDETLVYPAHGAGSMCGKNLGSETFTTIGQQRRSNYALQPMTRDQFIAIVTADQPEAPAYFGFDAEQNRRERPTLDTNLERVLKPMSLEEVLRAHNLGAQVLDSRAPADFASGALAGSVNVGLNGKFASWAGTVLSLNDAIVIVADHGKERETALRLGRIGLDRVLGYLEGGFATLRARPDLVVKLVRVTASALQEEIAAGRAPLVVDVRTPAEYNAGHVAGALHVPLAQLPERASELPSDRELTLVCKSGYRSCIASSLLRKQGAHKVRDIAGGMDAWAASNLPMQSAQIHE